MDGIEVEYVHYLSPPRGRSYARWGAWAAPPLGRVLRRLRRRFPWDLVHAHYAVPTADAVLRAGTAGAPLVISEHGGDVFHTVRLAGGEGIVRHAFDAARIVLANSSGVAEAVRGLGARDVRVVHLGADVVPAAHAPGPGPPVIVTVGHLVPRKRHADVLRAVWLLGDRHPDLRWLVIGDGPERGTLERLADELGLGGRVTFTGQLPHDQALARLPEARLFVMPSTDEALGVAYLEAMAVGLPVVAARGEPGPEDLARAGDGTRLVPPGDIEALAREIDQLLDPAWGVRVGAAARATVAGHFTWEACGRATVAVYEDALRAERRAPPGRPVVNGPAR